MLKDNLEQMVDNTVEKAKAVVELAEAAKYSYAGDYIHSELNKILTDLVNVASYSTIQYLKKLITINRGTKLYHYYLGIPIATDLECGRDFFNYLPIVSIKYYSYLCACNWRVTVNTLFLYCRFRFEHPKTYL